MGTLLRSGFFWRFVGGFALGAAGLASIHASAAPEAGMVRVAR